MSDIKCPYCHHVYEYEWWENRDDVFYEEECPLCYEFFEVAIETEVIARFKIRMKEDKK